MRLWWAWLFVVVVSGCATSVMETAPVDGAGGEVTGVGGDDPVGDGGYGGMIEEGGMGGLAEGGMGGDVGTCDFTHLNSCPGAQTIPSIAGDQSGPTQMQMGDASKWFQIQITEEDSNIFETDLSYTVTLESPPGMDYDLIVHQGPQDGDPNCNATPINGQPSGNIEAVHQSWDDDQGFGGEDDSLWLSIEVRHVSGGLCGPGNQWVLSITGHT